eukprot:scaffold2908_cov257-Pinguiococcus_pyrenoidosus.AAC.20
MVTTANGQDAMMYFGWLVRNCQAIPATMLNVGYFQNRICGPRRGEGFPCEPLPGPAAFAALLAPFTSLSSSAIATSPSYAAFSSLM